MDLGVLLESPQGSQSSSRGGHARALSSRAVAAVSLFPSRGSRNLWLSLRLSHEAFPRGFPTGLSHVPPWCVSILGLKVEAVQGKQVSLEWTETSGGLREFWHDPRVPLDFPVERASSEMRPERREFFPNTKVKDHSSRAMRRKRCTSGCGQ